MDRKVTSAEIVHSRLGTTPEPLNELRSKDKEEILEGITGAAMLCFVYVFIVCECLAFD